MPSFAHPWVLVIAPLAVFLVWRWSRRARQGVSHALGHTMHRLPLGKSRVVSLMNAWLRGASCVALVLGLAGPRWPDPGSRYITQGVALFLILDVSGSMAETDYTWNQQPVTRLQAAQNVLDLFVMGGTGPDGTEFSGRPDDLIGLITCATRPEIACPLTLAHDTLVQIIRSEQPRRLPQESQTNIGDAVALALQHLIRALPPRKAILLLTDGEHNVPPPALSPLAAARLAAALGVPIHAIDLGSDQVSENPAPGESRVDRAAARQALTNMATATGGRYFQAADGEALAQVCRALDTLEKSPIETPLYRKYHEGAVWFGLAGLVGMWSAWLLSALFCPVFP
jgi:Ca-activated chloride channel homolog